MQGSYDEDLWDAGELLPEIAPVREQLLSGDLRPALPRLVGMLPR